MTISEAPPATTVALTGVPETMLWTLHGRAGEAARPDALLSDPECLRVYRSIDYDYVRHFGQADRGLAIRAKAFDDVVRPWLADHKGGTVVELAAGLETGFFRCDDGAVRWACVDMPEAVAVRERFLPSTDRHRNLAYSALDFSWFDEIDSSRGVFVSAQGLFMYFERSQVQRLCAAVIAHFPGVVLMFDTVPRWFATRTHTGMALTRHYHTPKMPWGINTAEIAGLVRGWSDAIVDIQVAAYSPSRGIVTADLLGKVPALGDVMPSLVTVRTRERA